jgi:hypothetical protein
MVEAMGPVIWGNASVDEAASNFLICAFGMQVDRHSENNDEMCERQEDLELP